jgi:hypothetical protein
MERQQVLGRASVVAVIDRYVLDRCIGSSAIMADQCAYLASLVQSEKIALHVMPDGISMRLGGGVALAWSKSGHVTVAMGTWTRDITSTAAEVVNENLTAFDAVLGASMPVVQSLEFTRQQEAIWKERALCGARALTARTAGTA